MDQLNIHIDSLVVGVDADLVGQIRAAAGAALGPDACRHVAEQVSAGIQGATADSCCLDARDLSIRVRAGQRPGALLGKGANDSPG
jgi:hypothetical protein